MNSKERLGARVGLCNFFAILSERLGSLGASVKCTVPKNHSLKKNFSFSLHEQDQGATAWSVSGINSVGRLPL